jgi:competence protein ComGF
MGILKQKVKGSTLVEVLVAMVIIMTATGIGLAIYENLARDINDDLKIKAEIQLENMAAETKKSNALTEVIMDKEDMRLQRSIETYEKSKRLKVLHLEAFTLTGKKITEYREIIVIPDGK